MFINTNNTFFYFGKIYIKEFLLSKRGIEIMLYSLFLKVDKDKYLKNFSDPS